MQGALRRATASPRGIEDGFVQQRSWPRARGAVSGLLAFAPPSAAESKFLSLS